MKCLLDKFEVLLVSVGQILPEKSLKTFKTDFSKNVDFCNFSSVNLQKSRKLTFFKKTVFNVLMVSPVIFDLQRRTIPQINSLNISF